jgi:hypothetical protein
MADNVTVVAEPAHARGGRLTAAVALTSLDTNWSEHVDSRGQDEHH